MKAWFSAGYLPLDLVLRRGQTGDYAVLRDLGAAPFDKSPSRPQPLSNGGAVSGGAPCPARTDSTAVTFRSKSPPLPPLSPRYSKPCLKPPPPGERMKSREMRRKDELRRRLEAALEAKLEAHSRLAVCLRYYPYSPQLTIYRSVARFLELRGGWKKACGLPADHAHACLHARTNGRTHSRAHACNPSRRRQRASTSTSFWGAQWALG